MDESALLAPDVPLPTTVRLGDVTLIHGDCLKAMPTLKPQSVQLVFADLPYGVTQRSWDQPICLDSLWAALGQVTSANGMAALSATMRFASAIIASNPKHFRYDLVWDKTRTTGFLNANKMPLRRHEHILIFSSSRHTYNPQKTPGKPWSKRVARRTDLNYGHVASDTHEQASDGWRHPTSILAVPSGNAKSLHPTQKPVALLEWLIKTYTNPGDTILDPVSGSGTTAIAALNTSRKAVCIEKDRSYFEVMHKRVAEHHAKMTQGDAGV